MVRSRTTASVRVPGGTEVAGQVNRTAGDDGAVVAGQRERGLQRVVRLGGLGYGGITELLARFGQQADGQGGLAVDLRLGGDPDIKVRQQLGQHLRGRAVADHADEADPGSRQARAVDDLAEGAGLVTVVGAVQVDGGIAGHAFEAGGEAATGRVLPDLRG